MREEILTKEQIELLPVVNLFSKDFGLVGGTAVALHIGHRESIDFDLFSTKPFDNFKIKRKIAKYFKIYNVFKDEEGQYTFSIKGVRFTFFHYPYKISYSKKLDDVIKIPDLLTLAAMKAFALGRRAKWKDYVDLYFIMKNFFSIKEIVKRGKEMFGREFNEKIFRVQLAYFKDIDYTEKIIYVKGFETDDKTVKKSLIKFSLN